MFSEEEKKSVDMKRATDSVDSMEGNNDDVDSMEGNNEGVDSMERATDSVDGMKRATDSVDGMKRACVKPIVRRPKKAKRITIDLKKEIIKKSETGSRLTDLAYEYDLAKSTICCILKKKEVLKAADVAKGVTILCKKRSQVLEDVEKLLLIWIYEKQHAGDSMNEPLICEKALLLHYELLAAQQNTSAVDDFKASRGWYQKFCRRNGIHCAGKGEDDVFVAEFENYTKSEGYVPQQVFNCDETEMFWRRMPKRTYLTQEEKSVPGHKPMKDLFTLLLCANASGDCRIKPLLVYHSENPRAFHRNNVNRSKLPVLWKSNSKAWVTTVLFVEWLTDVFAPTVKNYLVENNLPLKCLLLMDNAPAHPLNINEALDVEFHFITVKFMPPKVTPLVQPMNQQIISNFKKLYVKALFSKCLEEVNENGSDLRDFWRNQFNILHCIDLLDEAWNNVSSHTLKSAWHKVWPSSVSERDFDGFQVTTPEYLVHEIVTIGKTLGLEVSKEDVDELVEEPRKELTTTELLEIQKENVPIDRHFGLDVRGVDVMELVEDHRKNLTADEFLKLQAQIVDISQNLASGGKKQDAEEHRKRLTAEELLELQKEHRKAVKRDKSGTDVEMVEIPSSAIEEMCSKWNDVQSFIKQYHPDKRITSRAVGTLNYSVISYFQRILQQREQVSQDSFLIQKAEPNNKRHR